MNAVLSREDIARRILTLPPDAQAEAAAAALRLYGPASYGTLGDTPGARAQAERDPKTRRKYAGDPWAYFADILGVRLTEQQKAALELIEAESRVLIPSANNMGKTFLLGGYGAYVMDARAAMPDDEGEFEEQGGRVLLPGPDHDTVFATIYSEMLEHLGRAQRRGHLMPGRWSQNSVLWRVRAKWEVEAFSPPKNVAQQVAHQASGRHHRNQVALIEEGQGVEERLWRASEGMCSSEGNKIVSSFNPTEPIGPAYQRALSGAYKSLHLDAFDHPNIVTRSPVVPQAIDFRVIDARVRNECRDRGRYPDVRPEDQYGDFVYALPPRLSQERGPRTDAHRGHPDGDLRVYRPSLTFTAQVRGQWPSSSDSGLFDPGSWDAAVRRWLEVPDPSTPPDRVGTDPAREGDDDTCAAPAWGDTAEALLRKYVAARDAGEEAEQLLRETGRVRVGEIRTISKGDGPHVAHELVRMFGTVPYNVDIGSVGTSPYDYLVNVLAIEAADVSFAGAAPDPVLAGLEPWCENVRASMYVRAALLVRLGLADVPDDPLLREEVLAHELKMTTRSVLIDGKKKRVPSVLVIEKDIVKKKIGRSPDRADAYVLSQYAPAPKRANTWEIY